MNHRIHQEITLPAPPARVFAALTDAGTFSKMSGGAPAEIDPTPGGAFSCFGGMIVGRTLECMPDQELVQAWRAKTWPAGAYSVVRFHLEPEGEQTRVTLDQAGHPDGETEHLEQGWHANYWDPMTKMLT